MSNSLRMAVDWRDCKECRKHNNIIKYHKYPLSVRNSKFMDPVDYQTLIDFLKFGDVTIEVWEGKPVGKSKRYYLKKQVFPTYYLSNLERNSASFTYLKKDDKIVLQYHEAVKVTQLIHEADGGHIGRDKVLELVFQNYYWTGKEGMVDLVKRIVRECPYCLQSNPPKYKLPTKTIIADDFWDRAQMDITYMPSDDKGNRYILLIIDCFTKYAWGTPLDKRDATSVVNWMETFLTDERPFKIIQSDNGGEFVNEELKSLFARRNIKFINSTPRHPQTNGQIEKLNDTVKRILSKMLDSKGKTPDQWTQLFSNALQTYNNTLHSSIGMAPYTALTGIRPVSNYELPHVVRSDVPLEERVKSIRKHLEKTRKKITTSNKKPTKIMPGDRILCRAEAVNSRYLHRAIITEVLPSNVFKVMWVDVGPEDEPINSVTTLKINRFKLDPRVEQPINETFGSLFTVENSTPSLPFKSLHFRLPSPQATESASDVTT